MVTLRRGETAADRRRTLLPQLSMRESRIESCAASMRSCRQRCCVTILIGSGCPRTSRTLKLVTTPFYISPASPLVPISSCRAVSSAHRACTIRLCTAPTHSALLARFVMLLNKSCSARDGCDRAVPLNAFQKWVIRHRSKCRAAAAAPFAVARQPFTLSRELRVNRGGAKATQWRNPSSNGANTSLEMPVLKRRVRAIVERTGRARLRWSVAGEVTHS
jgi:hypothetical protein